MTIISPARVFPRGLLTAVLLAGMAALCGAPAGAQSLAPGTAPAAEPSSPFYLSLIGRPGMSDIDAPDRSADLAPARNPGFYLGGVVGYAFTGNLRAEIEAFYRNDRLGAPPGGNAPFDMTFTPSRFTPGVTSAYGGMARGLWEFGKDSAFAPYVGGGVGLANVEYDIALDGARDTEESNLFAYEFTAGARFTLTPRSSIRAGYRLTGTGDADPNTTRPAERTHAIEFGINYRF